MPFGDDGDLHIARQTDDLLDQVSPEQAEAGFFRRTREEDLRDLMQAGKLHQDFGGEITLQHPRLNVQAARKIQVLIDCLALGRGRSVKLAVGADRKGEAIRLRNRIASSR